MIDLIRAYVVEYSTRHKKAYISTLEDMLHAMDPFDREQIDSRLLVGVFEDLENAVYCYEWAKSNDRRGFGPVCIMDNTNAFSRYWAVEYSRKRRCYNFSTLELIISANTSIIRKRNIEDWTVVRIYEDIGEIDPSAMWDRSSCWHRDPNWQGDPEAVLY